LIWALKAQFSGRQLVYQMSQVDMASPTAGLGGSINYRAGPVTLCLQLDNIVGGARTDTSVMFDGSRAADMQDGVRQTHEDSRAVRISFVRAL
jgi:microcystin degradation protein MlrC